MAMYFQKSTSRELSQPLATSLPAAATHKQAHMLYEPRVKEISEQTENILPLPTHPLLLCNAFSNPRVLPLSPLNDGRGTVTDLSSVPPKRTTDNLAFEGLNMHERPERVRPGGGYHHCVTPYKRTSTNAHMHTLYALE